jgi:hypothetical protein
MKIEVFQLDWKAAGQDMVGGASLGHSDAILAGVKAGHYGHVATCRSNDSVSSLRAIEEAWVLTNSIDRAWLEEQHPDVVLSPEVAQIGGCRSTSVGDVMLIDGRAYFIANIGSKRLPPEAGQILSQQLAVSHPKIEQRQASPAPRP